MQVAPEPPTVEILRDLVLRALPALVIYQQNLMRLPLYKDKELPDTRCRWANRTVVFLIKISKSFEFHKSQLFKQIFIYLTNDKNSFFLDIQTNPNLRSAQEAHLRHYLCVNWTFLTFHVTQFNSHVQPCQNSIRCFLVLSWHPILSKFGQSCRHFHSHTVCSVANCGNNCPDLHLPNLA